MQLQSPHALLPLSERRPQRLTDARGLLLRARRGTLWITIDHDPRDIVLTAGKQWVVDSSRPVIVSAMGAPALVEVCDAALRRVRERQDFWGDTLRGLWDRDARWTARTAAA